MQRTIVNMKTDERVLLSWHDGFKDYSTEDQYRGRFFRATGDGLYFEYRENGTLDTDPWTDPIPF